MESLRMLVIAAPSALVVLGAATEAAALERRVPRDYRTIQAAIDAAADGDVVRVARGVYRESIVWEGKNIALIGAGAWATIVDPSAGPGGRCLMMEDVPSPAYVQGITCRRGTADTGGGILIRGGSPSLRSSFIRSSTATAGPGGGMRIDQGSVVVEGCAFQDNAAPTAPTSSAFGGGLYAGFSSQVDVRNSLFARNSAGRGGGMSLGQESHGTLRRVVFEENTGGLHIGIDGRADVSESAFRDNTRGGLEAPFAGFATVRDTVFDGNTKDGRGGGMYARLGEVEVTRVVFVDNTATLGGGLALVESESEVTDSWFTGNLATGSGGGLGIIIGDTVVDRCHFQDNEAAENGGGIQVASDSFTTVKRTELRGNRAGVDGGGMSADYVFGVTWENCIFSDNTAGARGGGVSLDGFYFEARMVNSTLTRNEAGEHGGGLFVRGEAPMSILNTILWANEPGEIWIDESDPLLTVSVTYSDVQGGFLGTGNIDADPRFVSPSSGNLRLRPRSPARDAGFDDGTLPPTDFAGNPRVIGPAPDMGAYEMARRMR